MTRSGFSGVSLVGAALVFLGAMFLLENSGLLGPDPNLVGTYWPLLLIAWGLWGLIDGGLRFHLFPIIMTALGVAFLLSNLGLWTWAGNLLWPAVLIVVGLALLFRRGFSSGRARRKVRAAVLDGTGPADEEPSGKSRRERKFQANHFFSGGREQVTSQEFPGGEVSAVFGGMELDLREASLAEGRALLEATVVCGGLELRVPADWRVTIETTILFGGTEIKRSQPRPSDSSGELTVTGTVVFGGIEVKD